MEILEKKEEPLLSRIAVKATIVFEAATPSNEDIAKKIADALKKDVKLVVVKKIATHYGERQADIDAVVYDSVEAKEKTERKTKAMKDAEKKKAEDAAKPKEEAPTAEEKKEEEKAKPKEEAPEAPAAEEKKEEAKPEEKKE